MGVSRPFKRTVRQFTNGLYSDGGSWMYVMHPDFAIEPEHYIRSFVLLQNDLRHLFEYVEPADANLASYSFRIHALLMRVCIEIEANCKAILEENGYGVGRPQDWNMSHYRKLEATHNLSSYEVALPEWRGARSKRKPFSAWATGGGLPWYQAYNVSKHDRHGQFSAATFDHLLDAMCGLVSLLASQFWTWDYPPNAAGNIVSQLGTSSHPGFDRAIGDYFLVGFPTTWPPADRYDFDWHSIKNSAGVIGKLTF